jgi:hypothetical protein
MNDFINERPHLEDAATRVWKAEYPEASNEVRLSLALMEIRPHEFSTTPSYAIEQLARG